MSVPALLRGGRASAAAITDESGRPLTYGQLEEAVQHVAAQLAGTGIVRADRVAIAMANGPAAAASFLGVCAAAIAAPLNPAYTEREFRFALEDLPAAALVTDGTVPAAVAAAQALGVRHLRMTEALVLDGVAAGGGTAPKPGDLALVLHTSGTTGRPKRVPLSHANLTASAANIASWLQLGPDDRCLNVMPLFHIHGLVGAVLSSLAVGASVVCTRGFDAFRYFAMLEGARPTWSTAVPTMHHAVLARGRGYSAGSHALRFLRSSSAPLAPSLMRALEELFEVPVIEAYGMTEASHQIACNPLPPGERRPGTVGLAAGIELAVFSSDGVSLPPGAAGEVAIRGDSVTAGYEGVDPTTFGLPGGWLRTGDQGILDADGYLSLTGRLKELVNRGGEKISPREVEEALLAHPAVAEAIAFAVPHATLGEEVGAAIVLEDGTQAAVVDIRSFAAGRLAAFKVPRRLVVVPQIPLGPTGKPQRAGMAERLGLR